MLVIGLIPLVQTERRSTEAPTLDLETIGYVVPRVRVAVAVLEQLESVLKLTPDALTDALDPLRRL